VNHLDPKPPQSESLADTNPSDQEEAILWVLDICKELFGKFCSSLHRSSSRSAQSDIDADHWPVNVNAIVPNAPKRLTIAF